MKTQPSSSIKNTSLFKLYDLENDYLRHKKKLSKIRNKNAKQKVRKQYNSQVNAANQLRKNWLLGQTNKTFAKQKQIYEDNKLLYDQIIKVRKRPHNIQISNRPKIMSQSNALNRSQLKTSHSINRQNSQRKIKEQNERLMEKILSAKSPLSKDAMKTSYKKIKETKKRLETYSSANKSRIKSTLTKFHLKPQIYFPVLKQSPKANQDELNATKNSHSSVRLSKIQNEFLSLDVVTKKNSNFTKWQNKCDIPYSLDRNLQIKTKQFNKTKQESPRRASLNKTKF